MENTKKFCVVSRRKVRIYKKKRFRINLGKIEIFWIIKKRIKLIFFRLIVGFFMYLVRTQMEG